MRFALFALALGVAACTDTSRETTPAESETPAAPDTVFVTAGDSTLAERPTVPLVVEGACPFEGCTYGSWTTTAQTTVYAQPSTSSKRFAVPAQTVLRADRGFMLFARLGMAVVERDTEMYLDYETAVPLAAGDTLVIMDAEGEGSYRAWSGGRIAFTGSDGFAAPPGESAPLRQVSEPESQWWAHVTLDDGREGWLWMDDTPPVEGADAFG